MAHAGNGSSVFSTITSAGGGDMVLDGAAGQLTMELIQEASGGGGAHACTTSGSSTGGSRKYTC